MKTDEATTAPRTTEMTTEQIARRLVALCREAKWETAQRELFSSDAMSIEPPPAPGCEPNSSPFPPETKGLDAIIQKGKQFDAMIEKLHSLKVSDPLVGPSSFACTMHLDVSFKGQGRMQMGELCVYEVRNGKIVAERFFV